MSKSKGGNMSKQQLALKLAYDIERVEVNTDFDGDAYIMDHSQHSIEAAAAELRRLHAVNGELLDVLESIAGMYDYEASASDLASRLYEACCVARCVIDKAEAA